MGTEDVRPAFYALRSGGWRDYITVLHLPYTAWNLAYVALGAALAPHFRTDRMLWTMAAFALALGVSAHMLDELNGRPLKTHIPSTRPDRSRRRRAGGRVRDRDLGRDEVGLRTARLRRRRRVRRPRLQPRVVRRADPQRLGPRARLGRAPGPDRVLRPGGHPPRASDPRRRLRDGADPRPARTFDAGPRGAAAARARSRGSSRWSGPCGSCRGPTSCSPRRSSARA